MARGSSSTEVDYLCGEIVRLARLAGITAPANVLLQQRTHDITAKRIPVASLTDQEILARLG